MNLKLCASRHNIDHLDYKLKMSSLILTEQGTVVYGAIASHPIPLQHCSDTHAQFSVHASFCADRQLLPSSARHECEVNKIEMQASPAYTSVAMTTPMGPQCEDGAPPKYMNVNK